MFNNLSVSTKIFGISLAVLVISALVGIISLVKLSTIVEESDDMGKNLMPSVSLLAKMRNNVDTYRRSELQFYLKNSEEEFKKYHDRMGKMEAEMNSSADTFKKFRLNDEEKKMVNTYETAWKSYAASAQKALALIKEGKMEDAQTETRGNGKKLYEYARKNQEMPQIAPRPIEIMAIKRTTPVIVQNGVATFSFFVHCGKGTYIRSLCRDIGLELDSCATMTALRRLSVGAFTIAEASPLSEVQNGKINLIDPIEKLGMSKLKVDAETAFRVKNGSFLAPERFASRQDTLLYDESDVLLAIYTFDETINMMRLSVLF